MKSYFTIPNNNNFLNDEFKLELTEESRELFEAGKPGQGYTGLVDIITGKIYLYPSFNKNDGLLAEDKEGKDFNQCIRSRGELGSNQQDLHDQAASLANLLGKSGRMGCVMGFGIWKAGCNVRIGNDTLLKSTALIPNDYILVRKSDSWQLIYILSTYDKENSLQIKNVSLDKIPKLKKLLSNYDSPNIPNDVRHQIENEIHQFHQTSDEIDSLDKILVGIKFAKNRSTSQNTHSIVYANAYQNYFRSAFNVDSIRGATHETVLPREIPHPIFEKIMRAVYAGLNLRFTNFDNDRTTDKMVKSHFHTGDLWEIEAEPQDIIFSELIPFHPNKEHEPNIHLIKACLQELDDPNRDVVNYSDPDIKVDKFGNLVDEDQIKKYSKTLLTEAVYRGYPAVITELLCHQHIDPNLARKDGETPLTLAVKQGDPSVLVALLSNKDKKIDIHKANHQGELPLQLAKDNGIILQILKDYQTTIAPAAQASSSGIFSPVAKHSETIGSLGQEIPVHHKRK